MPDSADRRLSVSRTIAAPAEAIFAVVTDPAMHAVIDGSGSVRQSRDGNPERLELGSKFSMGMRIGLPYNVQNTVVEYETDRLIAWRHMGGHRWRYELEPVDGGAATKVTETFDWSTARFPPGLEWMRVPQRHQPAMEKTLERLEDVVTGSDAASDA
jgi:uncharacterized protein YndB with AHSA1/START domain